MLLTGTPASVGGRLRLSWYSDNLNATPKHERPKVKAKSPDTMGIRHLLSSLISFSLLHIFVSVLQYNLLEPQLLLNSLVPFLQHTRSLRLAQINILKAIRCMKANILKRMSASLGQQIPIIYPRIYWKTKL